MIYIWQIMIHIKNLSILQQFKYTANLGEEFKKKKNAYNQNES